MREYAALPGRAGQRRGDSSEQGDFEKRMEDLHLDPSDQSKSTSPDRPPAGGGRAVRRDDFGGSMRAPPHSTFRESALGDTRRSVDIPSLPLRRKCRSLVCEMICSAARAKAFRTQSLPRRPKAEKAADYGHASSRESARRLAGAAVKIRRATLGNLTSFRRIYELIMRGSRAGRAGSLRPMRSSLKISETRRRVTSPTARSRMRQPICAI